MSVLWQHAEGQSEHQAQAARSNPIIGTDVDCWGASRARIVAQAFISHTKYRYGQYGCRTGFSMQHR